MRSLALFKEQKGESVAQLESFQESVSLPSTVKTIWSLRDFTLTSLYLVLVWCFYYLGSQASQREFELVDWNPCRNMNAGLVSSLVPCVFQNGDLRSLAVSCCLLVYLLVSTTQLRLKEQLAFLIQEHHST